MSDDVEAELIAVVRNSLEISGLSVRAMAEAIGVPYRTFQNQLLGNARLPASTYVKAIGVAGGGMFGELPPLNETALASALEQCLGRFLPAFQVSGPQSLKMQLPDEASSRPPEERMRDAERPTFFVAATYNIELAQKTRRQGPQQGSAVSGSLTPETTIGPAKDPNDQ